MVEFRCLFVIRHSAEYESVYAQNVHEFNSRYTYTSAYHTNYALVRPSVINKLTRKRKLREEENAPETVYCWLS